MTKPMLSNGQVFRALMCTLGLAFLLYFYYLYLVKPALMNTAEIKQNLLAEDSRIEEVSEARKSILDAKANLDKLKSRKEELDKIFTVEKNISPLTRTVKNLAQKHSVDLRDSVKVTDTQQLGHFLKANCTLTAVGQAANVRAYLDSLAAEGCLIKTVDMTITSVKKDNATVKMSMSMDYYRYNQ